MELSFQKRLELAGFALKHRPTTTLQVNLGKKCNQACTHCHVDAGPYRQENMTGATIERVIELLEKSPNITTIDLTGGAPELNPHFRDLVIAGYELNKKIKVRCNLTVLFEPGQEETILFFKYHKVHVIASLPCYSEENVDSQRGRGVFQKSIDALRQLNACGYASKDSSLILDLVYNPSGTSLPPQQDQLEKSYRQELLQQFGIRFSHLYTMTNMPINRFAKDLQRHNQLTSYLDLLEDKFNICAAKEVMCRDLISVSWDGRLFDCDFNQMIDLPIPGNKKTIWHIESFEDFDGAAIAVDNHCYGCTAGAGSSCTGSLT